jgi:hypothetical protein
MNDICKTIVIVVGGTTLTFLAIEVLVILISTFI